MHEMAHGIGVGTQNNWWSPTYRSNGDRGTWLGDRVDRVVKFLENNANAVLNGDNTHMWPYGINGAHEDTGARMLYYGNGLIVEALGEDNLPPTSGAFATPAYTFEQDDEAKYYIKNESLGLTTSFLREGTSNRLNWAESTFSEAYANDSCAWYIRYNPATCYYTLKNAATGHVVSYSTTGANGFRLVAAANNTTNLQLMAARNYVTSGTYTFSGKSYWLLSSQSHAGITATANGATSAANFNHANTATAQRWLLLTADEAAAFAEANGETTGIRQTTAEPAVRSLNVIGGQGKAEVRAIGGGQEVRISAPDGRLIRRMIRDARRRGTSARETIRRWDSVRRGEERNIFPNQETADVMFNSALVYELAVLKQFAEPLLMNIPRDCEEYQEAKRLLKFLSYFLGVSSEWVPTNSLLREFVGGGVFNV
jgi:hypothetical protein